MKLVAVTLSLALLSACAAQPTQTSQLLFRDTDAQGQYARLYTRGVRLSQSPALTAASNYLVFLLDQDEQGLLLMTASNYVLGFDRLELSIDGETHALMPREKFARQAGMVNKQAFMFHCSRELLQQLASARQASLRLNGGVPMAIDVGARDRLSLLLVSAEFAGRNARWSERNLPLAGDGEEWLAAISVNDSLAPGVDWGDPDPGRFSRIGDSHNLYY